MIRKGRTRKLFVLDSVISTVKNACNFDDDKYLIMAPTGKATSNMCRSTIYSCKEGLSMQIKSKFKELSDEQLQYF